MRLVNIDSVVEGMKLGETIHGSWGQVLLHRGVDLTGDYLSFLRQHGFPAVYIDDPDTSDIAIPEAISSATRARVLTNLRSGFESVASRVSLFRQSSLELAIHEVRSERFCQAVHAIARDEGFSRIFQDVDVMLEQLMSQDVLLGLDSIKTHDGYTFQHSIDVAVLGILLARKAGWDKARTRIFGIGCILHDMGKIFIDPAILNKPGPLTAEETAIMQSHPLVGHELIRAIAPGLGYLVPQVAFQHHEREDGTGYPRSLRGDHELGQHKKAAIHEFGSLSAVADVYDALTSNRSYRPGWSPDRAVDYICSISGSHFNREAVDIFTAVVTPFPVCSHARVLNGRYRDYAGVISDVPAKELTRPRIRLMTDASGRRISPFELDLSKERDISIRLVQDNGAQVNARELRRCA